MGNIVPSLHAHSNPHPSAEQYFEHTPSLAPGNVEADLRQHDSQPSNAPEPEIDPHCLVIANKDPRVDALAITAQGDIDHDEGACSSQQPQGRRQTNVADWDPEKFNWSLVPSPLTIVKKAPTSAHTHHQAAAGLDNDLVEANPSPLQQREGQQGFSWQQERGRPNQTKDSKERPIQEAYNWRYAAHWPDTAHVPVQGESSRQHQPQLESRDGSNAHQQGRNRHRRQHTPCAQNRRSLPNRREPQPQAPLIPSNPSTTPSPMPAM